MVSNGGVHTRRESRVSRFEQQVLPVRAQRAGNARSGLKLLDRVAKSPRAISSRAR